MRCCISRVWRNRLHRCWFLAQLALMVGWLLYVWRADTEAYSLVYIVCGAIAVGCMKGNYSANRQIDVSNSIRWMLMLVSVLYASAVCCANYRLFEPFRSLASLWKLAVCVAGGICIFWNILLWTVARLPLNTTNAKRQQPIRFFVLCFCVISAIYLVYLRLVAYPGYFTQDTITAFMNIATGYYEKRIPVWHTLFIKLCLNIGYFFGRTGNSALVIYSVVQAIAQAAVIAYTLTTLYEVGVPKWCIGLCFCVYSLFSYNIAYSVTIWKDIPFGIGALAMAVALYRIVKRIGNMSGNYGVFSVASLVFCLARTNGWYSFFAITIVIAIVLRDHYRKLLLLSFCILACTWILLNPVLDLIASGDSDYLEVMGIPFQQIARVIHRDYEEPEADIQLLEEVFDLNAIANLYDPGSVDPIKYICFDRTRYGFFMENLEDYISLWVRWGIRHPADYIKAWIDQTKGFWNGGYCETTYVTYGEFERLGFIRGESLHPIAGYFDDLFHWFDESNLRDVFCSIGLNVWVLFGCVVVNYLKKRKEYIVGIPSIVILIGLWLCTPVYAEFRYAWPVFLTVPFFLCVTVYKESEEIIEAGLSL